MATTTLPHCHRDLNQSELDTLEALIDAAGIEAVLQGLSEICGLKADHIAETWQDAPLAKRWATLEGALSCTSTKGNRPLKWNEPASVRTALAGSNLSLAQGGGIWPRLTTAYT